MKSIKMRKLGGTTQLRERKESAMKRLQNQLQKGTKPDWESDNKLTRAATGITEIPLTDADRKRIEKEITTLKYRV